VENDKVVLNSSSKDVSKELIGTPPMYYQERS
jgi:hypothetical protein